MKINKGSSAIPNDLIIGDESILKKYGEKAFLIMLYINIHRSSYGKAYISLANCIEECGYKLNDTKGKTNDQFKTVFKELIKDKKIITNTNKFKLNDLIICELEEMNNNFFELEQYQYDWIINSKSKSKKINLLKLFCLIKARIYKRQKDEDINDGLYETCFPSYKDIKDNCLISESSIKSCIDNLVNLKLIKYDNLGQIYNPRTGETKKCNNTYAIYKKGWEEELNGSMRLYKQKLKEQGWKVIKK
ncbi:hypothetical protein [Clostridium perfringens]|uniref:hypothetical protein n=1 Tax=Clostridium perfringens TaxID=1502 RepID=UPI0023421F82|nr:hypothetical protein [Clostridium perfringens]MDC4245547.1 hypothetical protein [Clostridium perfringens]